MPLPNLIIIGAAKCGTTSLHHYLSLHPDVFMAVTEAGSKELRFFDRPDWAEHRDWYASRFRDAPVRGESTPRYTFHPHVGGVPGRMHALVPDARLIYVVRDPIDRILSHWVQRYWGGDRTSFEDWMADLERPDNMLVCPSRYAAQVELFLDRFDREQLLILDQADLRDRRAEVLREVFAFAGVDPDFTSPAFEEERNTRAEKRAPVGAGARLWDAVVGPEGTLGRAGGRLPARVRSPIGSAARRALFREAVSPPELSPALRARLRATLQDDVDRFRSIAGRPFAHWSL